MSIFEKVKNALNGTQDITSQKVKDVTDIDSVTDKMKETSGDDIDSSDVKKPEKDSCCGGNCGG